MKWCHAVLILVGLNIAHAETQSSVSQYGITWTFDREYETGRFVTGDWWVVGPVRITSISPVSDSGKHGSMINPSPTVNAQGYDNGMALAYHDSLNAALDVPLALPAHSSLISSISLLDGGNRPSLQTAAILTVVDSTVPEGSFRPPYCGNDKTVAYHQDQLDYTVLKRLAPVDGTPILNDVERMFERPWIDHNRNSRSMHPQENMPDYGREISTNVGIGALMLLLDYSNAAKEILATRYVQLGIDLFGIVEAGGDNNWYPDGGHASGRKWPIMFAGLLLGNDAMVNVGDGGTGTPYFGADAQTFYVDQAAVDMTHSDDWNPDSRATPLAYGTEDIGLPEWGIRHAPSPELDNRSWDATYRVCCTATAWAGFVLAALVMGVKEQWHHNALFDYMDRYMATETSGWRQTLDFVANMWDTYRGDYGSVYTGLADNVRQYDQSQCIYDCPDGIRAHATPLMAEQKHITAYTGPAHPILYFAVDGTLIKETAALYDARGLRVKTAAVRETRLAIPTAGLPEGVYFLEVPLPDKPEIFKIIIIR